MEAKISVTERVDDLLSRMTLEEKASQMLFTSPAIDRLDQRQTDSLPERDCRRGGQDL